MTRFRRRHALVVVVVVSMVLLCIGSLQPTTIAATTSVIMNAIHPNSKETHRDMQQQQQQWNTTNNNYTTTSNNNDSNNNQQQQQPMDVDMIEYRSVLIVRILEESDPNNEYISSSIHTQLNTILFNGNTTFVSTTTANGIVYNTTGTSVSQQMLHCSMGHVLLQPLQNHIGGYIWDIILPDNNNNDVISSIIQDRNDRSQWIAAAAYQANEMGYLTYNANISTQTNEDGSVDWVPILRNMANHVIIILPPNYPNEDYEFLASAEVNHSISVFDSDLTNSLSMYMHELGHNLFLQHSGGYDVEQLYGDKTGYMGTSDGSSYFPLKCYNAAQHWQLNWYTPYRTSLLSYFYENSNNQKWSKRLQVNAFVDAKKLDNNQNNIVLVQIDDNMYLQFNRAKSYNIGTPMLIDNVVLIRDLKDYTQLIKGLNMTSYHDATYQYRSTVIDPSNNQTITTDVTIQLCDIVITNNGTISTTNVIESNDDTIDYAIIGIGMNMGSSGRRRNSNAGVTDNTLCSSNFITTSTYTMNGPPKYMNNSTTTDGNQFQDIFDSLFTQIYEINVLLLILIGCTSVFVLYTIIRLFVQYCIIKYCCCNCRYCYTTKPFHSDNNDDDDDGTTTNSITEYNHNDNRNNNNTVIVEQRQQQQLPSNTTIPQVLPKVGKKNRLHNGGWLNFPWFSSTTNHRRTQQQQQDHVSQETIPSNTSSQLQQQQQQLPVATLVQIY